MWSVIKSFVQQDVKRHLDSTQQENSCTPAQNPIKNVFVYYKVKFSPLFPAL